MKDSLIKYRDKLEEEIKEYANNSATQRNSEAITSMLECLNMLDECIEKCDCETDSGTVDFEYWDKHMKNEDGTVGGHWGGISDKFRCGKSRHCF